MNTETLQARAARLVQNEVHCCLSSLVNTMARGYGAGAQLPREVVELHERAFELTFPVNDWESAAADAGWTGPFKDEYGATYFEDPSDDMTWNAPDWRDLCNDQDIEPYQREVFEHWAVSNWLAEKLIEQGEKVDTDFAGLNVWARTTTGQAISIDAAIEKIVADLVA
jgi:hypothetical protein